MKATVLTCVAGIAAAALLAGCVTSDKRPLPVKAATRATAQQAESQLLDVAVELFDPNVPAEEEQQAKNIDPKVRNAEARYLPVLLANTLRDTGYWGQVRVVPRGLAVMDVHVSGTILDSRGGEAQACHQGGGLQRACMALQGLRGRAGPARL